MGYSIMAIPMAAEKLRETLFAYRDAYRAAGHPGNGEVMLALHMFVDEDGERARRIARPQIDAYFRSLLEAANDWTQGTSSADYKDYDKKYERLSAQTMESLIESGSAGHHAGQRAEGSAGSRRSTSAPAASSTPHCK